MSDLFSLDLKTEDLVVKTTIRLISIKLLGDHFAANYEKFIVLPDDSELVMARPVVDRSIDAFKDDGVDFNGTNITLTDFLRIAVLLTEKWRAVDEANVKPGVPVGPLPIP